MLIKASAEFFFTELKILFWYVHREIKIQRKLRNKGIVKILIISLIIKTPILWRQGFLPFFSSLLNPNVKSWIIGKDSDAEKEKGQEEKGATEDEMVGWCHHLNGQVVVSYGRWWRTEKPGMLRSMNLQRVKHNLVTRQQQQYLFYLNSHLVHNIHSTNTCWMKAAFATGTMIDCTRSLEHRTAWTP